MFVHQSHGGFDRSQCDIPSPASFNNGDLTMKTAVTPQHARISETTINGLDLSALRRTIAAIKADSRQGLSTWGVTTTWKDGMYSESTVDGWSLGGQHIPQDFTIKIDEPRQLLGGDAAPNPQEYLLAAMNACMLNTFVAACSLQGVNIESLELRCNGDIDLRGFLGIDPNVAAGYEEIQYTIRVKGDGTHKQYEKAHQAMVATSPNYFNIARPISLTASLEVID
jgi:uncharacterized OsmC-like protein